MFASDDKPHPDWEMNQSAQRRLSLGAVIVAIVFVLANLAGSSRGDFWPTPRPPVATASVSVGPGFL